MNPTKFNRPDVAKWAHKTAEIFWQYAKGLISAAKRTAMVLEENRWLMYGEQYKMELQ